MTTNGHGRPKAKEMQMEKMSRNPLSMLYRVENVPYYWIVSFQDFLSSHWIGGIRLCEDFPASKWRLCLKHQSPTLLKQRQGAFSTASVLHGLTMANNSL